MESMKTVRHSSISVSIVTYASDEALFRKTLSSLINSFHYARSKGCDIRGVFFIVDNGSDGRGTDRLLEVLRSEVVDVGWLQARVISGHGNVGYGNGHNLAIQQSSQEYHLILNPDVILDEEAIYHAVSFMETQGDVGLIAPSVFRGDGKPQYLVKRYPSVFDLLLRGFAPPVVKQFFNRRLQKYEMRDIIGAAVVFDISIISGCFMFFRRSVLIGIGGFSKEYFLYFEDFDISLRTKNVARIAYVPAVRITHFGGNAAKKGWRHIMMFARSGLIFFNKFGWRWF